MDTAFPTVIQGGLSLESPSTEVPVAPVEIPQPPAKLSAKERKVWEYVTQALEQHGLIHSTDGLLLTVICKTFCKWVDQEAFLEKLEREHGSYYVKTPNGYEQPHQAYYVARNLKRELLQWLPEAALTIPSFQKMQTKQQLPQGDLFGADPLEDFRQRKARLGMRAIPGGASNGADD